MTNGGKTLGFINPDVYRIGVSSNYDADFHDIIKGGSPSYAAVEGFDLVTGWDSPNGQALIDALVSGK